jgi:membrane associated rhomboid family serine protease
LNPELRRIIRSLYFPVTFVILMWTVRIFEVYTKINLGFLGIYPLHVKGLPGILASPLIHAGWAHLYSNTIPILILLACIFYFYKEIAFRVTGLIWLITGIWVWFWAREAYHIGASGVVYGLFSFVFLSGLLRRNKQLMAISFMVGFTYGSLVWGIFPELFPDKDISWESHLMGLISGSVIAWYYRKEGPQRMEYQWNDDDDDDDENAPWKLAATPQKEIPIETPEKKEEPVIHYIYKEKED